MKLSAEDIRPKGFDAYPVTLGDMLRGERATAGKSLADVHADLKIGSNYISAIENGDLQAFETKGFIAGYVRSYARYLNLDGDKAYKQFCLETGFDGLKDDVVNRETPSQNDRLKHKSPNVASGIGLKALELLTLPAQSWYERVSFSAIGSIMVLLTLVIGLGYGGWWVLQEVQRVQFAPVNETPGVASNVSVLSEGVATTDPSPEFGTTTNASISDNMTLSLDQLYRPQELDLPSVISRDGPIVTIDPETLGTYAPSRSLIMPASIPAESTVAVVEQEPPRLDIVATRPAWVRVYLPDNSVLFEKILNAGERYRLPNDLQGPLLKAGNSGAVYFMIGQKIFGPVGKNGGVSREVSLAQSDIKQSYSEVLNLFSEPLAPPLNAAHDKTAEAILKTLQND
ncbi:MAG: RodZ domain-containing protein [Amylibacter sp.]